MSPKKIALWFLIVSVAISAALGIIAVLTGNFGELEVRIIVTTLTISAASICALACGALGEARGQRAFPAFGIVMAVIAAILIIVAIWGDVDSKQFWKLIVTTGVLAAVTAHACLLSLAKLARRFAWARPLAIAALYTLAAIIIISVYFEPGGDLTVRLIGATSIVVAAITVMTPIFHRLSRADLVRSDKREMAGRRLWATISCPECGATQPNSLAETTCDKCGCRFTVNIIATGQER